MKAKWISAWCGLMSVALAGTASAQNLLTNGNFATDSFAGWALTGDTSFSNVVANPSGGFMAQMGSITSLAYLTQTVATTIGTQYTLSYEFASDGETPNHFEVTVGGTSLLNLANTPVSAFTTSTFSFTATSVSTSVQFGFEDIPGYLDFTDAFFGLNLAPTASTFASIPGLDPNEVAIASTIDNASTGAGAAITHVVAALTALPTTEVAGALDQLSPQKFNQFASTTAFNNETFEVQDMDSYLSGERLGPNGIFVGGNGQVDTHNFVVQDPDVDPALQMVHSRMLAWNEAPSAITDVPGAVLGGIDMKEIKSQACPSCTEQPWNVFVRGNVVLAQGFSQNDVPHFDDNTASVTAGADYRITNHVLVGLTASYAHTDATLDDLGSSATVDSYSPGVYASYTDSGWFANFIGRYSYNSYTDQRSISFLNQTSNGATDGNEGMADLDGGYEFHSGAWTYGPVAGLQYTHLTVNGYTESGSAASLAVDQDEADSLRSRVGGEVRFNACGCGVSFSPHLTATWQHEFMDQSRGINSQFNQLGGGSFTVQTDSPSRDSALVDLGLDAKVNDMITVFGDYVVNAGQENYFGQSLQAGVRVNF